MGFDLSELPDLKSWYEKLHCVPGFEENLKGAKVLADVLRKCYEDELV